MQLVALFAALCTGLPALALASSYEPDEPYRGHVPAPAFEIYGSAAAAEAAAAADRDYAAKMRKHHQGVVTMSRAYLADHFAAHIRSFAALRRQSLPTKISRLPCSTGSTERLNIRQGL